MKMHGCDHIRCLCGAHWCWSCERSIDVCFSNPCQAQLEDGIYAERDTDDEEDQLEAENRTTTIGPTDGIPYEYPTPSERAPVSTETPEVEASIIPPSRPRTPASAASAELDSVETVASPVPGTNATPTTDDFVQPDTVDEENLDDPDQHDWEYLGMDFGGEPMDERWDVWGCAHKCRRLNQEDIHENWLRLEDLECQNCFERVYSHGQGDPRNDTNGAERLAWLCKKCGVIFCEQCRRDIRAKGKQ